MLPKGMAGMHAIELGCGTGYVSSWLVRAGARPVGIDISQQQLATARAMQAEFGVDFPLVLANAERVPFQDSSFGLAISEYGASLWCDPHRWIPEAARLLSPGGRLVFLRPSPLFALCVPVQGQVGNALLRPQFGLCQLDWGGAPRSICRMARCCGCCGPMASSSRTCSKSRHRGTPTGTFPTFPPIGLTNGPARRSGRPGWQAEPSSPGSRPRGCCNSNLPSQASTTDDQLLNRCSFVRGRYSESPNREPL
jgi:SAM-dependent methyltransferase